MTDETALTFDPASLSPPLDLKQVLAFQEWLHRKGTYDHMVFDPDYLAHLRLYNGGIPNKRCFKTESGRERMVIRFLHFDYSGGPLAEYNVESTWSLLFDRLGVHLMPFAELFGGDFVCLEYINERHPRVVVWLHEESEAGKPVTEPVCATFQSFLHALYTCSSGIS